MASVSVYRGSDKGAGPVRFRLSDGRGVCLYWSAGAGGKRLPVEQYKIMIAGAYERLKTKGVHPDSNALREEMSKLVGRGTAGSLCSGQHSGARHASGNETEDSVTGQKPQEDISFGNMSPDMPLVRRYRAYVTQAHESGFIGKGRYMQCCAIASRLERWLRATGREEVEVDGFDSDMLLAYRQFLFDEYLYAEKCLPLYLNGCRPPSKRRKNSSVVMELKALKAFFTELENLEEIRRSPFRKLSREKQKSIMHVMYDAPIFLRTNEFQAVKNTVVPRNLEWVRDIFIFNCCIGSRIGDIERLGTENIGHSDDGTPYIHYMPTKTRQLQNTNCEIETPLIPVAMAIAGKGFPSFKRSEYNSRLRQLLRHCGIVRQVRIFNETKGSNDYVPLWQAASSKLARKTHVDIMNKVQLNPWASGLHKIGSRAVFRYTFLELRDRYRLMKLAFGDDTPAHQTAHSETSDLSHIR